MKQFNEKYREVVAYFLLTPEQSALTGNQLYKEVKVIVDYDKGGMNYFSGSTTPRGYKLLIKPVTRNTAIGTESCTIMGVGLENGLRFHIEEAPRYNKKRLLELADQLEPRFQEFVNLFFERRNDEILKGVRV